MTVSKVDPMLPVPGRPIMVIAMVFCHLIALLALLPYFFSWTGVALAAAGAIFSTLGINICYHRMLAHRGVSCSKRVEHCLALMGVLAHQFGPAYWVAIHRRHHQATDSERDPHTPHVGFYWSHIGWLFAESENTDQEALLKRYAPDLLEDPFYAWLEKNGHWGRIVVAAWLLYFVAGASFELLTGGNTTEAVRFGASLVVWGAAVRTVVVWHSTFAVNSVCHTWGYRNHATRDDSRNNPLVALLAFGEGWHNNHHASPRSARHGHKWWELDLSWLMIRALAAVGLMKVLYAGKPGPAAGTSKRADADVQA